MNNVCPKCNNKRHIYEEGKGWVRCECIYWLRVGQIMSKSGFPDVLWDIDKDSFMVGGDKERQRLKNRIDDLVENNNLIPLFIYSETPDKDRVAAIICRYAINKNLNMETVSYTTIDQFVQRQFGKPYENQSSVDPVTADITVISIGREMTNAAHRSSFYTLLYDRILSGKFTIVCSFLPQNRILQVYLKSVNNLLEKYFEFYSC